MIEFYQCCYIIIRKGRESWCRTRDRLQSQWNTRDRETNGVRQAWSWNRVNAACVTMNYSRCCTRDYKKKESVLHAWRKTVRVVHETTKQNWCRTRNREAVGAARVTMSSAQYYTSFTFSHVGAPRMMQTYHDLSQALVFRLNLTRMRGLCSFSDKVRTTMHDDGI